MLGIDEDVSLLAIAIRQYDKFYANQGLAHPLEVSMDNTMVVQVFQPGHRAYQLRPNNQYDGGIDIFPSLTRSKRLKFG